MELMERGGDYRVIGFLFVNVFAYWPYVFAQEVDVRAGFLSLACGRSSSFTDSTTGIYWTPDKEYISTGTAWSDSLSSTTPSIYNSLRYFPRGRKNCYSLDVRRGGRYLIKGTHVYLNHDGHNRQPEFDVAIDATIVFSVKPSVGPQLHEVVVTAEKDLLNYCLLTREGLPVISSLEVIPLSESSYADASHGALTLVSRGSVFRDVRYDDNSPNQTGDVPNRLGSWTLIAPDFVLKSVRSAGSRERVEFRPARYTEGSFIVFLSFAQRVSGTEAGSIIFDISANGEPIGHYDVLESQPLRFSVTGSPKVKVAVEAAETSSRKLPRVCFFEVHRFIPTVEGTQDSDVEALMSIKRYLNRVDWAGDPCLPIPWDGVTCETQAGGLFVTGLDISSHNVTRLILDDIRKLTHLTQLRVDLNEIRTELAYEYKSNFRYRSLGRRLLSDSPVPESGGGKGSSNNLLKLFIGIASGVIGLLALIVVLIVVYCYRRRRARFPPPSPMWTGDLPSGPNYIMKSPLQDPMVLEMQSNRPQELSLKEVQTVTEKFKVKIGEGGFGAVYYGTLPNGRAVAVKVRSLNSNQGTKEFTTELELLRNIENENLVSLVGFCTEMQQQILVYPYMSNGSLHDRLYDKSIGRKPLDWLTRLNIVLGAARGISFLHTGGDRCIIHRDVKSSNILLDDSMKAKIADFGLSKVSPKDDESLISTEVRGTAEYLDPEYYQTHQLTEMSDVYSFGIVLLETVCGREPLNMNRPYDERSLVEWVRPFIKDANIQHIVDPEIQTYTPESLWRVVEIALQSVEPHSSRRPTIAYIVRELEDALIIENNASQYMASIQSFDSLCTPTGIDKDFSRKEPLSYPLTFPFEPSPVFSETMNIAPDPR